MTFGPLGGTVPCVIACDTVSVWVTSVDYHGGALAHGRGETEDGGRIEFACEPRVLWAISEALEAGDGPVLAAIPTWWSISRHSPSPRNHPVPHTAGGRWTTSSAPSAG